MDRVKTASLYIFFGLLAYMPLHIFISTWIGTSFNWLEFAKIAKDIALVAGVGCSFSVASKKHLKTLINMRIVQLILAYGALTLLFAVAKPTDQDAEVLGVVYNTRFLLMFLYGLLLTEHYKPIWLTKKAFTVVGGVGFVVVLFGLLQYVALSTGFMEWFGYSRDNGVLPAFFIDDKPELERIMSTLRDPNSYGSYLILLTSFYYAMLHKVKRVDGKKLFGGLFALSLLNLLFTFSRSAWIGAALALLAATVLLVNKTKLKTAARRYRVVGLASLALICVGIAASWNSYLVQNVVFHADESTVLEDPNELRGRFLAESVDRVVDNPVGHGPGTAGLASIKNDDLTILNENYYLQIAHEVGVIGLLLFVLIILHIEKQLYQRRQDSYATVLFASLIGLSFTNLLVHIWSNEAIAYTWWALASLVVAQGSSADGRDKAAGRNRKQKSS